MIKGTYDTYGDIQMKIGMIDGEMRGFEIGDKVDLPPGIYVGYGGFIVIDEKQTFAAVYPDITDKWGNIIDPDDILDTNNPVSMKAIEDYMERSLR